jgi:hypothetical protein
MLTIQIHDEELARRLEEIAQREQRPVEEVLKTLLAQYPTEASIPESEPVTERSEVWLRVRRKAYAKARQYWQSAGDSEKAALSDEELHEQFAVFDEEGIPRLKSELKTLEPPVGSLAYAAKIIREMGGINTGGTLDATRADDILNEEFADYLLKRMKRKDAAE